MYSMDYMDVVFEVNQQKGFAINYGCGNLWGRCLSGQAVGMEKAGIA